MTAASGVSYGRRVEQRVVALVNALRPAELALRDYVRPLLGADLVALIAELDHGMEVEQNRRAIEELLRLKRLPQELPWPPREVLELASNGDPDDPRWRWGLSGRPGHVARLFACVVLVRADDMIEPASRLAALIGSAVALGPEATEDAVRYLAWCRLNEPGSWRGDPEALPFLTLGLLLAYLMSPLDKDPETVEALTTTVVAEFAAVLDELQPWWPTFPAAKVVKSMVGGDGYRGWQALVDRCVRTHSLKTESLKVGPLRSWFGV